MSKMMSALGREIIVELLRRVLATGLAYMGVDVAREGYGTVAEKLLRVLVRDSGLVQYGGEAVTELVGGELKAYLLTVIAPANAVLHFCEQTAVLVAKNIAAASWNLRGKNVEKNCVTYAGGGLGFLNVRIVADKLDGLGDMYDAVDAVDILVAQSKRLTAPEARIQAYLRKQGFGARTGLHGLYGGIGGQFAYAALQVPREVDRGYHGASAPYAVSNLFWQARRDRLRYRQRRYAQSAGHQIGL